MPYAMAVIPWMPIFHQQESSSTEVLLCRRAIEGGEDL
jgi:hypothetical protein